MALDKLVDSTQLDADLTTVANAIRTKGGTSASLAFPSDFVTAIAAIPSGGGTSVEEKDVNFYDYDGSVVDSYSAVDFANLAALPANPSHTGLTAQGWNWTLSDAKTYVASYGKLDIGHMYVTDDGKTRIHIKLEEGRLAPYLGIAVNGTVDIDWGDGTTHGSLTGTSLTTVKTLQHTYSTAGEYTIVLNGGSISVLGYSNYTRLLCPQSSATTFVNAYQASVIWVQLGSNATIGDSGFGYCRNMQYVTIPSSVNISNNNVFNYCQSLKHLTLPTSTTKTGNYLCYGCYSLTSVSIPKQVTDLGTSSAFNDCRSLRRVIIPSGPTSIPASFVRECRSLKELIMPNTVTSLGGSYVFSYCTSLKTIRLSSSLTSISSSAFEYCGGLANISIPSSVTSIGSYAFNTNTGLGIIKFEGSSPPSLGNSSVFSSLRSDCKIYVPSAALTAYTSASNYPSSGTYTYVGY